jgi:hypothetical protein
LDSFDFALVRVISGRGFSPFGVNAKTPRPSSIPLALVVVAFGGLRVLALANDLWMDEVWTLWHVGQLQSMGEIFSRFTFDNNHPLNSVWMYLTQPLKTDWIYRLLALVSGSVAIWLAAKVARIQWLHLHPEASGQTPVVELLTATLFGSAYLLTVYSSEARGYGPALGFGLLAIYALLRGAPTQFGRWAVVYWVALIFALLAHAVTYQLIGAGVVYTAISILTRHTRGGPSPEPAAAVASPEVGHRRNEKRLLIALISWHAVPVAFGGLYYFSFMRRLDVVGGPKTPIHSVLGDLAAYSLGFPAAFGVALALPLLLGAVIVALMRIWGRSPQLVGFHISGMLVFPAVALWFTPFIYLFPRYFILSAAAALLLVGYLGALTWNAGRAGRCVTLVLTTLIVAGNVAHTAKLLRHGRGEYKAALQYMAQQTPPGPITVGSDHDGRNVLLVYHHGPAAITPRTLEYIPRNVMPPEGVQWILVHRLDNAPVPPLEVRDDRGNPYRVERIYLHAPLSGWDWYLYRSRRLLPPLK